MEMTVVALVFSPDTPSGTALWASEKVIDMFLEKSGEIGVPPLGRLEEKMRHFCNGNFRLFMPNAVKLEYGKTYGVHVDQYRIVGFFDEGHGAFIAIDWFIKKKQKNDKRMNSAYQRVDQIREGKTWKRKAD